MDNQVLDIDQIIRILPHRYPFLLVDRVLELGCGTGEDAVWWSIVTVATVGYGDRFPVTSVGRLIGTVMIVMGVSLFSVFTSYVATQFMARRKGIGPSETELLRNEMSQAIAELRQKPRFVQISSSGLRESHVHDVIITQEAPNYRVD